MSQELNEKDAEPAQKVGQKVHLGLAKEVWDEVLMRCGIDPQTITEYNVRNSAAETDTQSQK